MTEIIEREIAHDFRTGDRVRVVAPTTDPDLAGVTGTVTRLTVGGAYDMEIRVEGACNSGELCPVNSAEVELLSAAEPGEYRFPFNLKRGYHVRLADGRWGLLNSAPTGPDGRLSAEVVINFQRREWVTWSSPQKVFSRTPDEHMQAVVAGEFADLKVDATLAAMTHGMKLEANR